MGNSVKSINQTGLPAWLEELEMDHQRYIEEREQERKRKEEEDLLLEI